MIIGVAGACGGTPLVPRILVQPQAASFSISTTATLSVVAVGVSLVYQWYKQATLLVGKTSSTLSIANSQESDSGDYKVVVSNANGTVTSSYATLTIQTATPQITVQPQSDSVYEGQAFSLQVEATVSQGALSYLWQESENGSTGWSSTAVTSTSYSIQSESTKYYRCRVTSSLSGIIAYSDVATITVTPVFVDQPSSAGFSGTVANLSMYCAIVAEVGVVSYTPQRFSSGSWADVTSYSENLTNGIAGGTQTTTDQSITISTINPPDAYIASATYRIKVGLQAGGFTFSKPVTFSNVIRPGSISIHTPARYTGAVSLNQSFPAGIRAAWYYRVVQNAWAIGLSSVDAKDGVPSLAIPSYSNSELYEIKCAIGFNDEDLNNSGTNTIESASVPVLPAISFTSEPQDVTKYPLQAFNLTVETESADNLANLTYQWMAGSTEVSTTKTLNATPYHEGFVSTNAPLSSSAEGDTWCVNGASVICTVRDSLGNQTQSRAVQITISGNIKPVISSGYISDAYIDSTGSSYNDLETFGLTATCANAPSGRRTIYVCDENGSQSSYDLSLYPLGKNRNVESAGSNKNIPFTFVNAFGETSAGDFVVHFGAAPSSRYFDQIASSPGSNWFPADGYGSSSGIVLNVNVAVPIYLQGMGSSNGTGQETFTWFGKSAATNNEYVPLSALLYVQFLPANSEVVLGSNIYDYFIIIPDTNPVTIKLVNANNWGSSSSEVTFQGS